MGYETRHCDSISLNCLGKREGGGNSQGERRADTGNSYRGNIVKE